MDGVRVPKGTESQSQTVRSHALGCGCWGVRAWGREPVSVLGKHSSVSVPLRWRPDSSQPPFGRPWPEKSRPHVRKSPDTTVVRVLPSASPKSPVGAAELGLCPPPQPVLSSGLSWARAGSPAAGAAAVPAPLSCFWAEAPRGGVYGTLGSESAGCLRTKATEALGVFLPQARVQHRGGQRGQHWAAGWWGARRERANLLGPMLCAGREPSGAGWRTMPGARG